MSVLDGSVIPLAAIGLPFVAGLLFMIIHYCFAAWKSSQEIELKREMIARGYTAADIIAVLDAQGGSKTLETMPNVPPARPLKQPA